MLKYSVPVLYWDDWAVWWQWADVGIPSWLLSPHNEHFIVPTRLQILFFNSFRGGDILSFQICNYFLFGLLIIVVANFARRISGVHFPLVLFFFLFLLSPINYQNHGNSFQSQFHFVLLFFWITVTLLFLNPLKPIIVFAAFLSSVSCVYSLSSGIISITVVLAIFAAFQYSQGEKRLYLFLFCSAVIPFLFAAAIGVHRAEGPSPLCLPTNRHFWLFLFTEVATSLGIEHQTPFWGLGILVLVFAPIVLARKQRTREWWALLAAGLGILGALGAIALGRGALPDWRMVARSSRYSEISGMLIPLGATAWAFLFRNRLPRRAWSGMAWVFCLILFLSSWNLVGYQKEYDLKIKGLDCLRRPSSAPDYNCPTLYPSPLTNEMKLLERMNPTLFEKWTGRSP
jgi:hypothetical protein